MKRSSLFLATLVSILLTGFVLPTTGWVGARSPRANHHVSESTGQASACDPFQSDAAWRWRHCQPNHWRACLLKH
jgi:hypothetical protein